MKYTVIKRFEFSPGNWMEPGTKGDMLPGLCRRYIHAGYLISPDYEPPTKEESDEESPAEGGENPQKEIIERTKKKSK